MITSIETVYNGYRFRSRLEARWAVFLDAMGITYEYESEGYDLDGLRYLPDFWLPLPKGSAHFEGAGFWLEVKSRPLIFVEEEKIKRLVRHTGHHAYAVCGNIGLGEYRASKWALKRASQEVWCVYKETEDYFTHFSMWTQLQPSDVERRFEDALNMARGARFERGETPKVYCPPTEKWYVNSLGLSDFDGGGREWWIEAETQPGEVIYFCGNDRHVPDAATLAEDVVAAHNSGDRNRLRYLASFAKAMIDDEEGV